MREGILDARLSLNVSGPHLAYFFVPTKNETWIRTAVFGAQCAVKSRRRREEGETSFEESIDAVKLNDVRRIGRKCVDGNTKCFSVS